MMNRDALDRYITSGRYSESLMLVTCSHCGDTTRVAAETEYGATTWSPEECGKCKEPFEGDETWIEDEPDPDRMED